MAFYEITEDELQAHIRSVEKDAKKVADKVSVSQTLKHFVRDWTDEGASERDAPFECLLGTLDELVPYGSHEKMEILLPGAGLGRLGHDIAARRDGAYTHSDTLLK